MLVSSCISNLLANDFPGPGTIYMSQSLSFKKPVFLGELITVKLKILKIREDKKIMTIETLCENKKQETVLEGEAVVKFN